MQLSEHFTLEELTNSQTAQRNRLDNTPALAAKSNLYRLCTEILEPLREAYGAPIVVNCGYRSIKVNQLVGGASNSDHLYGAAADIRSLSNSKEDNRRLYATAVRLIRSGKIHVRQLINEYGYSWVHISINHAASKTKTNEIFSIGY